MAETIPNDARLLVTSQEACRLLSVSPRTLRRMVLAGQVREVHIGLGNRHVRFAVAELQAFVAREGTDHAK